MKITGCAFSNELIKLDDGSVVLVMRHRTAVDTHKEVNSVEHTELVRRAFSGHTDAVGWILIIDADGKIFGSRAKQEPKLLHYRVPENAIKHLTGCRPAGYRDQRASWLKRSWFRMQWACRLCLRRVL